MLFRELAERLRINPDEFVGLIEVRAAARRERGANFAHGIVDLVCNIRILDLAARNPTGVCLYVQPPFVDCMN